MARKLTDIYLESKKARDKYLCLTEISNTSKMSILDAITWITASGIMTFEKILDVLKVDIAKDLNNRVNGTPSYYASSVLKYQHGDTLEMNADGTAFNYPNIDINKQIVSKVSYSEYSSANHYDKILLLKVAKGESGNYKQLEQDEIVGLKAYVEQIKFAGTEVNVVSRKGDVLILKVTVYHDGALTEEQLYENIEKELHQFTTNLKFDSVVYVQDVIKAIKNAEHVLDVYFSDKESDLQGIFVAQYDDDNLLEKENGKVEKRVERYFIPNSGFIRESSKQDEEKDLPTWRESLVFKVENEI